MDPGFPRINGQTNLLFHLQRCAGYGQYILDTAIGQHRNFPVIVRSGHQYEGTVTVYSAFTHPLENILAIHGLHLSPAKDNVILITFK